MLFVQLISLVNRFKRCDVKKSLLDLESNLQGRFDANYPITIDENRRILGNMPKKCLLCSVPLSGS